MTEVAANAEPSARFGGKLFGQAKKARDQAQARASSVANKASAISAKAGELKELAATKAGEAKAEVKAKAGEIVDAGAAKLNELLADFNAALPVIRQGGYTLAGVDIDVGLPPKVTAAFSVSDDVSDERVEQLVTEHAERKLTVMLLKSLHRARTLQMKIQIGGLKPKGLAVQVGIIPTVTVKFA